MFWSGQLYTDKLHGKTVQLSKYKFKCKGDWFGEKG